MKKIIISFLAVAIAAIGYFVWSKQRENDDNENQKGKTGQSIAVLPFTNMSTDVGKEYFSDGLTEGILNSLAHIKGLKVCARTSSFKFKGKNIPIKEAGQQLGVQTVLEGSIQQQEDRVQITVQLVNVKDEFRFWSEQYDERIDDIFALEDKIAAAVAKKLEITLVDKHQSTAVVTNKEAYDLYLKGRAAWNLRTPAELVKGIDFFRQAIKRDSSFAGAYSGIADCYTALGYGSFLPPKEAFPRAMEAATKALQLDSTLAEPHASLGYYQFYYNWDWAAAEQEFRMAITMNPNYELGYDWWGYYLTAMKRYDDALIVFRKAAELDPLSVPINTDMGFCLYYSGNYDKAIEKLKTSLLINPNFGPAYLWLGRSYQEKRMFDSAIAAYQNTLQTISQWPVAFAALGSAYGLSGDKTKARNILDTLHSLSTKKFVTAYGIALVYTATDEKENAFAWLNKAYDEKSNWLVWLRSDPRFIPIRSDPRFTELVNKVGLPRN